MTVEKYNINDLKDEGLIAKQGFSYKGNAIYHIMLPPHFDITHIHYTDKKQKVISHFTNAGYENYIEKRHSLIIRLLDKTKLKDRFKKLFKRRVK